MVLLYFKCKKCDKEFNFDIGKVKINSNQTIDFQKEAACPICQETSKEIIEMTKENLATFCKIYDEEEKKQIIKSYHLGKLVNYSSIFGRDSNISLQFNSQDYYILDNYCVASNCNCSDILIDVYKKKDKDKPAEFTFSFNFDYISKKISEVECLESGEFFDINDRLLKENPQLFENRHNELKNFFKDHPKNKVGGELFKNKTSLIKIGRNEPCPCGSGKKYKKCCLDKDKI